MADVAGASGWRGGSAQWRLSVIDDLVEFEAEVLLGDVRLLIRVDVMVLKSGYLVNVSDSHEVLPPR